MKTNSLIILSFLFGLTLITSCNGEKALDPSGDFRAYYTHIITDDEFEIRSRTGDYADIIVDFGEPNGNFVFWRGSSYLPYWETKKGKKIFIDEIVPRTGDGTGMMPDKVNAYSTVKIIGNSSDKVIVHWRYLPEFGGKNPHTGVSPLKFVDEFFTFAPDGSVIRTIRKGTPKYDDWADPEFRYTQTFNLTRNNIINKTLTQPVRSLTLHGIEGRPLISDNVVQPVAWFRFDEGSGDKTIESISKTETSVNGGKTYWRRGVSGTSIHFDDVHTFVSLPASSAPKPESAITLESWTSIAAYPWNWCPMIQQADDVPEEIENTRTVKNKAGVSRYEVTFKKENDRGYFLGIDGHGHPGLKIRVGGNWEELTSDVHLERRKWYHLIGTYDMNSGKMTIYINGYPAGEKCVKLPGRIELSSKDLMLGKGKNRRQVDPVRASTFPGSYSFDGLIDEIKIYNVALSSDQVRKSFDQYNMNDEVMGQTDIPPRVLPAAENKGFMAKYSLLKYFDTWDNLFRFSEGADITVGFDDNPCKFIFWRGVSYIPMIANEKGEWYSNEFNETWNKSGGHGCQEPMSDKASLFSHVRIIENTPARVVVHWRFALTDVEQYIANYNDTTGWGDWADWYYFIYPDGIAAKQMHLWTDGERNHEWQESMVIMSPEQHPHNVIERNGTITMIAENGELERYDWITAPPKSLTRPEKKNIQIINLKGEYDPVTIVTDIPRLRIYSGEITSYAVFANWNHWPIAQMPSDGRYSSYPDRTSHTSLTNLQFPVYREGKAGYKPFYEKILLEGMLNKSNEDLVSLSKSWTHTPELTDLKGAEGRYAPEQRAYVLKVLNIPVTFKVNASIDNPIHNLCFVMKGWNSKDEARIVADGKVKQGLISDTDGTYAKVIYIEVKTDNLLNIEISR